MQLKKLLIPVNTVFFNLSRLIPCRNKHLWIFGALEGKKYDDNSKYMFEYVVREHPEIRCVWLTNDKNTLSRLKENGQESYLNSSIKGKCLQMKAGVAFYTHGLFDFGLIPLIGGAEIVALWHGMGFKKIYNGKYHGTKLKLKKILDHFFSWTYRTITPVTSQYAVDWAKRMFTLNPKRIYITGQPRNDVFRQTDRNKTLIDLGIDPTKKIAVYMPTYRQDSMGAEAMELIVTDLYNNERFAKRLKDNNWMLIVKLHPLTPAINLPQREDFRLLGYGEVEDNQLLMGVCDALITDYSSCYVDYALLHKPIIFYMPDKKQFYEKSEQLDQEFEEISSICHFEKPEDLLLPPPPEGLAAADAINQYFEDESIRGTYYSENVFNVVSKIIGH